MSITKNVRLNWYSSMKKEIGKIHIKVDFEGQIFALFDNSMLHQFTKFNGFLLEY